MVRKRENNTIILAYYGTGKSTVASTSDTITELTYSNNHPTVEQLQKALEEFDVILVDPMWKRILVEGHYSFHIVVPSVGLKGEYLERFRTRQKAGKGNGKLGFVRSMASRWEGLISELKSTPCLSLTELNNGQYLADVINNIV